MRPRRRRVLVRGVGVVGALAQLLVGLMGIVIFPAALVSVITAVAATRLVGRDLEAASMRFGVALLASGVGVVFGFASGAVPMIAAAVLSSCCLGLAWAGVQQLAREQRAAFGIRHRDWTRRDTELRNRRDTLRDHHLAGPPAGGGVNAATDGRRDDVGEAEDPAPWWEELG